MRILVFGNSGSGKSTLARRLAAQHDLRVLDLDHVVWSRTEFAKFRLEEEIIRELDAPSRRSEKLQIIRKASPDDISRLVALMAEFYAEADYPLNRVRAAEVFAALLADERLGHGWAGRPWRKRGRSARASVSAPSSWKQGTTTCRPRLCIAGPASS